MYLGDNLLEQDLGAFVDGLRARPGRRPSRRRPRSCSSGCPTRTASASPRSTPPATWSRSSRSRTTRRRTSRSSACTCSTRRSTRRCAPSSRRARGELEITDAIQWLITNGQRVRTELLTGWWIDTGKLTPLLEANRLLLEKIETRVDGSVDERSTIDGRVIVDGRRRDRQLDDPWPGRHRRRHPRRRQLHRPVLGDRRRLRGRQQRDRALGRDGAARKVLAHPAAGGQPHRPRGRRSTAPAAGRGRCG